MKALILLKNHQTQQNPYFLRIMDVYRINNVQYTILEDYNDEYMVDSFDRLKEKLQVDDLKQYDFVTDSLILAMCWYRIAHAAFRNFVFLSDRATVETVAHYPNYLIPFVESLVNLKGIEQEHLQKPLYINIDYQNYLDIFASLYKLAHHLVPIENYGFSSYEEVEVYDKQYNISAEENFYIEGSSSQNIEVINFYEDTFSVTDILNLNHTKSFKSFSLFFLFLLQNAESDVCYQLLQKTKIDTLDKQQFVKFIEQLFIDVKVLELNPHLKLAIYSNLMEYLENHDDIYEEILIQLQNPNVSEGQRYHILTHLSAQGFRNELKLTRDFVKKVRDLYKDLDYFIESNLKISWKKEKNKKRLVILNDQILSRFHAPTGVLEALCHKFIELTDYEILLIAEESLIGSSDEYITLNQFRGNPSENARELYADLFPSERVTVFIADYSRGILERNRGILEAINDFNPEYIFSFSAHSLVQQVLVKEFPLVAASHGIEYMTHPAHISLYKNAKKAKELDLHYTNGKNLNHIYQFFYDIKFIERTKTYRRQELNFKEDDYIIITSGNRISTEIDHELIDKMIIMLKEDASIIWLLVGSEIPKYIMNYYASYIGNQIRHIPFETDLLALTEICDVSINPRRVGGGYSVLSSMKMGVPVLMCNFESDGLVYVGRENASFQNYDEVLAELLKMKKDPAYKKQIGLIQKQRAEMLEKRTSVDILLEHFKEAEKILKAEQMV